MTAVRIIPPLCKESLSDREPKLRKKTQIEIEVSSHATNNHPRKSRFMAAMSVRTIPPANVMGAQNKFLSYQGVTGFDANADLSRDSHFPRDALPMQVTITRAGY